MDLEAGEPKPLLPHKETDPFHYEDSALVLPGFIAFGPEYFSLLVLITVYNPSRRNPSASYYQSSRKGESIAPGISAPRQRSGRIPASPYPLRTILDEAMKRYYSELAKLPIALLMRVVLCILSGWALLSVAALIWWSERAEVLRQAFPQCDEQSFAKELEASEN